MPLNRPQLYLIHGSDEVKVHQERTRLVSEILPREHRAENLTELEPASGRVISLRSVAADLMSELATASFFPEVPRVVVVEQLDELLSSSGGGEAKPSKRKKSKDSGETDLVGNFCRFLETTIRQTNNVLILVALEEPDKWRKARTDSPLYKTVQAIGQVIIFKQTALIFKLLDAFIIKDLRTVLQVMPEITQQEDGPGSMLRMLTRQVRFLIQAKLLGKLDVSQPAAREFAEKNFPQEKSMNLVLEHPYSSSKIQRASAKWSLTELNALLPKLERLCKTVYPLSTDVYVPDPETELELFLIEACGVSEQARNAVPRP